MARRKYKCKKLSAAAKRKAIAAWRSETGRKGAKRGCKLVVFGKRGCRGGVAVERCDVEGGLSKAAKKRFRRMKRRKEICLKKRGKRYFFSTKRC